MTRSLFSRIVALVLLVLLPGVQASAQSPSASPAASATPDPFALPANLLVLRIMEGNGFAFMFYGDGSLARENYFQVMDGAIDDQTADWVREAYLDYEVVDLYVARSAFVPEDPQSDIEALVGISIDIRLTTFPDVDAAERYVTEFPGFLRAQAEEFADAPQEIAEIEGLPPHDQALIGVTGLEPYYSLQTGESADVWMPFSRYVAQHGTTVASVKVTSADPAFSDVAAQELLATQLGCLDAGTFCNPVPLPGDIPYAPEMPTASPVAMQPSQRVRARAKR